MRTSVAGASNQRKTRSYLLCGRRQDAALYGSQDGRRYASAQHGKHIQTFLSAGSGGFPVARPISAGDQNYFLNKDCLSLTVAMAIPLRISDLFARSVSMPGI